MFISLKTKLLSSITVLILFFGVLAVLAISQYSKQEILDLEKENLEAITVEKSFEIGQIFSNVGQLVYTIARQEKIGEYMADPDKEVQEQRLLEHLEFYNIGDAFLAIYLMDAEGTTWVSTDSSFLNKNYGFREYFKKAIDDQPYVDVVRGVTSEQIGYYFSHPIKDDLGNILGVAVVKMKPDRVHGAIESNMHGHIMLVDSHGIIVHSDKEDRIYKSLGQLTEQNRVEIEQARRFSGLEIEPIQYDILQSELASVSTSKTFDFFDKEDNEEEILSVVKMRDVPFFIIIEEELDSLEAIARDISYLLALFVLGAIFLSILLSMVLVNKFLKPLKPLKNAALQVSKGNYDYYLNVDSKNKDELSELADSFNMMTKKIKKSRDNIEKQIADRTAKLEKLNKFMTGRELKMRDLKNKIEDLESKKQRSK